MNVYIYGGSSRTTATESLIPGNEQAEVGKTYEIDVDQGVLIVAYPNEDKDTDFGFNYWLEAEVRPEPEGDDLDMDFDLDVDVADEEPINDQKSNNLEEPAEEPSEEPAEEPAKKEEKKEEIVVVKEEPKVIETYSDAEEEIPYYDEQDMKLSSNLI